MVPSIAEIITIVPKMSENDVLIVVSLSGETPALENIIELSHKKKVTLIGISNFSQNYLGENADLSYYYCANEFYDSRNQLNRISLIGLSVLY